METLGNHVVELVAPFLLLLPRPLRMTGGLIQIIFQVCITLQQTHYDYALIIIINSLLDYCMDGSYVVCYLGCSGHQCKLMLCVVQVVLIVSGNLSFLNWLTLIPAIFCFDDKSLSWLFTSSTRQRVVDIQQYYLNTKIRPLGRAYCRTGISRWWKWV